MPDHYDASEPRMDECAAMMPRDGLAESTRAPRWVPPAMIIVSLALWLILAEL